MPIRNTDATTATSRHYTRSPTLHLLRHAAHLTLRTCSATYLQCVASHTIYHTLRARHTLLLRTQTSNQPPTSTYTGKRGRERSHSPVRRRSRSKSPPRRRLSPTQTKGKERRSERPASSRNQSFQSGAAASGLAACAIYLGRSSHPVRECTAERLWDGSKARCARTTGGHITNPQGNVICSDWQRPGGCSTSGHDARHECSGCGATDHGAQKCRRVQQA